MAELGYSLLGILPCVVEGKLKKKKNLVYVFVFREYFFN